MSPEVAEEIRQINALDADIARGVVQAEPALPTIPVSALSASAGWQRAYHDGSKFSGGFGATQLLTADYWTLRARSSQLFKENLYARGLIRRLITNEINTGLHLEATPEEGLLGLEEDSLADWSETIENRFKIWGKSARLCDHREQRSFGGLQAQIRMEALIAGDVLVVLRQDQRTGLPRVQLIGGSAVQTPMRQPRRGNEIKHGVEIDRHGRHVAFWTRQPDGTSKRLPARGEKSGRRLAWLVYGTDKRLDAVRGEPILSLVLQSLREIDRYRDSVQRKAVVNSMLAMFIKKTVERPGSLPITMGGAVRKDSATVVQADGAAERSYQIAELRPGLVIEELEVGEEPQAFSSNGTDERFGLFEEAIIQAVAWANEIPPEILRLAFSNNYSASAAAINEFKIYLNKVRCDFGEAVCHPIYIEWLISEVLTRKVAAPGLLEAWRDVRKYDVFGAWTTGDWTGHIKPSTDVRKQAQGYRMLLEDGLITRDRSSRELTGTKYSKNVKKLRRENAALAEALEPLRGVLASAAALLAPGAGAPEHGGGDEEPEDEERDEARDPDEEDEES